MPKFTYTVVMPGLFDSSQRIEPAMAPDLAKWVRRSKKSANNINYVTLLFDLFGYSKDFYNLSGLRARDDGLDPDACWLCADPIHLGVDVAHIYSLGNAYLELQHDEIQSYIKVINSFLPQPIELVAPHPLRWYLRLPQAWEIDCYSPDEVLAKSIVDKMPVGKDRLGAITLFNEIQMLLHDHPMNLQRRQANKPTLDALWLWGAGKIIEPLKACQWDCVKTNDPLARQLALLNAIPLWQDQPAARGRVLYIDVQYQYADANEHVYRQFPVDLLKHIKVLYPVNGYSYEKRGWWG